MAASDPEITKIIDPAKRITGLSPAKLDLLARRLKQKTAPAERTQAIPRRDEPRNIAPLSLAQERLWFVEQLHPGLPAFTLTGMFPFKGIMNLNGLAQSLNEIIRRHETFRTLFPTVEGQTVQQILPARLKALPLVDLGGLPAVEQRRQAYRLIKQSKVRWFDLTQEEPLRIALLMLRKDELVTLWSMHHIIFDDWSVNLFRVEVEALYKDLSTGSPSSLAELPIQYGDFAQWQRQSLEGGAFETQLSYWKRQLGDRPPLDLPTDKPRAARQLFLGKIQTIMLSPSLTKALLALGHRVGATLFMTLLAAFNTLLYRYTGQPGFDVGAVISNRNRSEIEKLIGFFLNTLVFHTEVSAELTFLDLINRVRQITLEAYAHADIPFESLIEILKPKRDSGTATMFRVWFDVEHSYQSSNTSELSDMQAQAFNEMGAIDWRTPNPSGMNNGKNSNGVDLTNYDLGLVIRESNGGFSTKVWYNSKLFHDTTIIRMLEHFRALLQSIVADPGQPMWAIPLLTEAERHQLLAEWNDTEADCGKGDCLSRLFEAQAQRSFDAVAVVIGDEQVTYGTLSRRSDHLARHLAGFGVESDELVAVMANRGIEFLTVMLAAFKAGVAYLPLDPYDPPRRLHQVLLKSKPDLVLAADEFAADVARVARTANSEEFPQVLTIETLMQREPPLSSLTGCCVPRNRSYVMYTSGSTGMPKGVVIEHAGMLNHLYTKISDLAVTADDVIAQNAAQTFDISVWQYLTALLVGGRVVVIPDEAALNPTQLMAECERADVTILETVPTMLRAIVAGLEQTDERARPTLHSLRWLISNAEALEPQLCRRWFDLYPGKPMINTWGATECSDDVTHLQIAETPEAGHAYMPLGRPLGNTRLYIVDEQFGEVPLGVRGELCIAGDSVGRGYLNAPEKTAESFVPDRFSAEPGARFYKTGDIGRYMSDRSIEFTGRKDHQVKIRGHRIELAEIEMALAEHTSVEQAIAVAQEDGYGDKRLVAYLVCAQPHAPAASDLRDFLQERLPDYMVPAAFVLLEAFPLSPNGKIDRRALPAPEEAQLASDQEWAAPESLLEKKLAEIWSEVLNVDRIGIYDNFFSLGGHSIMAIRVLNRINQVLNVNLSVRNVFEEPTIAGLALLIEEGLIDELERE